MAKLELVSPFPLVECQRLLNLGLQRSTAVEGSITGTRLRARKRIFYRNSFQIRLSASLLEEGAHTRIVCRFGMHPVVIAFLVVWVGALLFIGGGGIVAGVVELISGSRPEARDLVGLFDSGDDANVRRHDIACGPLSCCGRTAYADRLRP